MVKQASIQDVAKYVHQRFSEYHPDIGQKELDLENYLDAMHELDYDDNERLHEGEAATVMWRSRRSPKSVLDELDFPTEKITNPHRFAKKFFEYTDQGIKEYDRSIFSRIRRFFKNLF